MQEGALSAADIIYLMWLISKLRGSCINIEVIIRSRIEYLIPSNNSTLLVDKNVISLAGFNA